MTLVPVALIGGFPMAPAVVIDTTEVPLRAVIYRKLTAKCGRLLSERSEPILPLLVSLIFAELNRVYEGIYPVLRNCSYLSLGIRGPALGSLTQIRNDKRNWAGTAEETGKPNNEHSQ